MTQPTESAGTGPDPLGDDNPAMDALIRTLLGNRHRAAVEAAPLVLHGAAVPPDVAGRLSGVLRGPLRAAACLDPHDRSGDGAVCASAASLALECLASAGLVETGLDLDGRIAEALGGVLRAAAFSHACDGSIDWDLGRRAADAVLRAVEGNGRQPPTAAF